MDRWMMDMKIWIDGYIDMDGGIYRQGQMDDGYEDMDRWIYRHGQREGQMDMKIWIDGYIDMDRGKDRWI